MIRIESTDFNHGGVDTINLTAGINTVIGGADQDEITVRAGSNIIYGHDGQATFDNNGRLQSVTSTNLGEGAADTIDLTAGINTVIGGADADIITAQDGRNTILGDEGQADFCTDSTLNESNH